MRGGGQKAKVQLPVLSGRHVTCIVGGRSADDVAV